LLLKYIDIIQGRSEAVAMEGGCIVMLLLETSTTKTRKAISSPLSTFQTSPGINKTKNYRLLNILIDPLQQQLLLKTVSVSSFSISKRKFKSQEVLDIAVLVSNI
jgi:hypothetical protein